MNTTPAPIRVMLVDDQSLLRVGLRTIIDTDDRMTVVAEAGNGDEAIAIFPGARPDVILMDIQMPGMDGIAATERITSQRDHPAVVMLTTFQRDDYLFGALRAGAIGFLLKTSPTELILEAIATAASGNALLSPDVTRRVIEAAVSGEPKAERALGDDPLALLTDREREVLMLVAEGASNNDIAARLFIGEATVRTHLSSLFVKLGVPNRVHAVIWAYRNGVVEA
jgi:DNA-binding NarL/FixJ family response regulator